MAPRKNTPMFTIIALLLTIGLIAGGAYLFLQKAAVQKEISNVEAEIKGVNEQIAKIDVDKLEATQNAQRAIKIIEEGEILWSSAISKIQDITPVDDGADPKIIFSSYSGGGEGKLSLAATTRPDRGTESGVQAFSDVAELIEVFNTSRIFQGAFVPSIAKGVSEEGDVVLSFTFLTDYAPEPVQKVKRKE